MYYIYGKPDQGGQCAWGGVGGHGYVSPYLWDPICIQLTYFNILEIDCKIQ